MRPSPSGLLAAAASDEGGRCGLTWIPHRRSASRTTAAVACPLVSERVAVFARGRRFEGSHAHRRGPRRSLPEHRAPQRSACADGANLGSDFPPSELEL